MQWAVTVRLILQNEGDALVAKSELENVVEELFMNGHLDKEVPVVIEEL